MNPAPFTRVDIVRSVLGAGNLAVALLSGVRDGQYEFPRLWHARTNACRFCGLRVPEAWSIPLEHAPPDVQSRGFAIRRSHEARCARAWLDVHAADLARLIHGCYSAEEIVGIEIMCAGLAGARADGPRSRRGRGAAA